MPPEVTVVIPTHGRPQKTLRAIRSAARQPAVAVEIVVVDDASPQPFMLPDDLKDCVRLVRLDENVGPAGARNAGVAAASAPFLAFLDSDDFFLPGTLAGRLALLRATDGARPTLFAGSVWRWTPGLAAQEFRPIETDQLVDLARGCWYFPGSTGLMSRTTWDAVGPLDARLQRLEDLDWGIRLGLAGGWVSVTPGIAAVVERSSGGPLARVEAAADAVFRRYGPGGEHRLGQAEVCLAAYLELEKARAALAERRLSTFVLSLLRSLAYRPRLTLHQRRWWVSRDATAAELAAVERLAQSLCA
jgi:glycosyltransferase involved in cell wall biosynthesis